MKIKKNLGIAVVLLALGFSSIEGSATNSTVTDDCSVKCSFTFDNGYTVSTSAGSIFRTCSGAAERCREKLSEAVAEFMY